MSNGHEMAYSIEESKLAKLFEDALKDIFWAEKELTKALKKLAKKATSAELSQALLSHLSETEGQVEKLTRVFEMIGKAARGKKCEAMEGLIKEGDEIIEETDEGAMRDAGIIAAAQKVEHYEIASYGTMRTWANIMGQEEIAAILEEILNEEKSADEKLTVIAQSINMQAVEESE